MSPQSDELFIEPAPQPGQSSKKQRRSRAKIALMLRNPAPPVLYSLSESQRKAVDVIVKNYDAKVRCYAVPGFRAQPLLAGLSGSGKTHAVFAAARKLGATVIPVSPGTHIPIGAREKPTLHLLRDLLQPGGRYILLADETDKMVTGVSTSSAWSVGATTELYFLLDSSEQLLVIAGWSSETLRTFRTRCLIVGAGAWQLSLRSRSRALGFQTTPAASVTETVEAAGVIPEELLMRFSDVLPIDPPSMADLAHGIASTRHNMGLPPLSRELRLAEARRLGGKRGSRDLERYALRMAIENPEARAIPGLEEMPTAPAAANVIDTEGLRHARQEFLGLASQFVRAVHRLAECLPETKTGEKARTESIWAFVAARENLVSQKKPSSDFLRSLWYIRGWLDSIAVGKASVAVRCLVADVAGLELQLRQAAAGSGWIF